MAKQEDARKKMTQNRTPKAPRRHGAGFAFSILAFVVACNGPRLARDGTVIFPQSGGGASVLTANGIEFQDKAQKPKPVVSRDPNEPWRAPIGFILPKDGRFVETSKPTVLALSLIHISEPTRPY